MTEYTRYRCMHCGWEGEEPLKWEEKPRDEFEIMCPECHHTDNVFMLLKNGKEWVTYESIPPIKIPGTWYMSEKAFERFQSLLTANNVYKEAVMRKVKE